jgi:hypothetical protein
MALCRRVALALTITSALLLGGTLGFWQADEAGARPRDLLALSPSICLSLLMGDTIPLDCYAMYLPFSLQQVAALIDADNRAPFGAQDFAPIDLDGNQLHSEDGQLFILAFVTDDSPVTFKTSAGMFDRTSLWGDEGVQWVCDHGDEDCDGDGLRGDGVVVAWLWSCEDGNPAASTCSEKSQPGRETIDVEQDGRTMSLDFTVVGEPHALELVVVEKTIQTGLDAEDCPLETTAEGFAAAVGLPEKTMILARALDREDTAVTGAFISWKTNARHEGIMASGLTPTLDLDDLGAGTANVLCGTDKPGSVTVTGAIVPLGAYLDGSLCYEGPACPLQLDPMAESSDEWVEFTVLGPPASLELAAEPSRFVCDSTASSAVSAIVTDAEGSLVANGNEVRFDVRALGIATPITTRTIDGMAVSTITPLSASLQGVPVVVTVGNLQGSVLISCQEAASPEPPPHLPSPATPSPPSGRIMPPATGSGGYSR